MTEYCRVCGKHIGSGDEFSDICNSCDDLQMVKIERGVHLGWKFARIFFKDGSWKQSIFVHELGLNVITKSPR